MGNHFFCGLVTLIVLMTSSLSGQDISNATVQVTGASTARSEGQRWADVISVKDFGAVGDGRDDSDAIQRALNSTANFILLPVGNYRVTKTLTIIGSKTLSGPSGGSQAFQHATIYHDPTSNGELFNITSDEQEGVCLKNFNITGGNGSFAIRSSRNYVRFEYIHMEPYTGGGVQLLSTGKGSSSSKLINCQWVGPAYPTNYTGFEINVNGGDVRLQGCTAIRGAIGINIIQGQTIFLDGCSLNKQAIACGYSNASQFNTCGIKLTGSSYKQAISIRNSYIEACTNGIYVESCESLTVQDNLIDDAGVSGPDGNGNSCINLKNSNCKNISILNNRIIAQSNGTGTNPFYVIRLNDAKNVLFFNNYIEHPGDYSAVYYLLSPHVQYQLANSIVIPNTELVAADYTPNGPMCEIFGGEISGTSWVYPSLSGSWITTNSPVQYRRDASGFVHLQGCAESGSTGTIIFTLPIGYRPSTQQSFIVNTANTPGVVTVFTNGNVVLMSGAGAGVYLSSIAFSTTS